MNIKIEKGYKYINLTNENSSILWKKIASKIDKNLENQINKFLRYLKNTLFDNPVIEIRFSKDHDLEYLIYDDIKFKKSWDLLINDQIDKDMECVIKALMKIKFLTEVQSLKTMSLRDFTILSLKTLYYKIKNIEIEEEKILDDKFLILRDYIMNIPKECRILAN